MHNFFSFEMFERALQQAGSIVGAAEMHGLQTGMICGDKIVGKFNWDAMLVKELNCKEKSVELLQNLNFLYVRTFHQLRGLDFQFDLLLPAEDAGLQQRATALADWCRGFICGLAIAGISHNSISSKMAKEAIKDLSELAHFDICEDDLFVEHQSAFFELVEYVKVAVQTVQIDLTNIKQYYFADEHVLH